MIVRELLTRLGFDADTVEAKKYEATLKNVVKVGAAAVAGAGALAAGLFGVAKATQAAGDEAAKTARRLGIAAEELQSLRYAAGQAGVNTSELNVALKTALRNIGQAADGAGPASEEFKRMGISIKNSDGSIRGVSDILPEVADRLQSMATAEEKAAAAGRIFGEEGAKISLLLENGSKGLAEAQARFEALGGAISNETAAAAEEMGDALDDLSILVDGLKYTIGAQLIPIITKTAREFQAWYMENREIIRQNINSVLETLVDVLGLVWSGVRLVAGAINYVAQAMGGWGNTIRLIVIALSLLAAVRVIRWVIGLIGVVKSAIAVVGGLGGALKILGAILMRIPIFAIIAAVALLIDELWNWYKGNKTIIGDLLGTWDEFKAKVVGVFDSAKQALINFWNLLAGLPDRISNALPGWLKELLGVGDVSVNAQQMQAQTYAGNARREARNINQSARVEVNLQVPMGTPEAQAQFVRDVTDQQIRRTLDETMRGAANNFVVAE